MRKFLTWTGGLLGALLVVMLLFLIYVYVSVDRQINQSFAVDVETVAADASDSMLSARGAHLATIFSCRECHGQDLAGQVYLDVPPFRVVPSNLTRGDGGVGTEYAAADWVRAIRHGVAQDGGPIPIMPAMEYSRIGKADLTALISYLQSLPPVDNELPSTHIKMLGRIIMTTSDANLFFADDIDHEAAIPAAPAPTATAAYGNYLYDIACTDCHGASFEGGPHPDPAGPAVPTLAAAALWPDDAFATTMRTGMTPGKVQLDPKYMPWHSFRHMTDMEVTAIHRYLQAKAAPAVIN